MMRWFQAGILLAALFSFQVFALIKTTASWKDLPRGEAAAAVAPPAILKITSLDFDGVASDYFFLKSLVFLGSTFERKDLQVKEWEWKWVYGTLDASSYLDPYFRDPYYLANGNLTWGGGLVREANALLERGTRYRDWDALLPFYLGFNRFYFLMEYEKASEALMIASKRPGASPVYGRLAIKLAYRAKRTDMAIELLEHLLTTTEEPVMRREFEKRIEALKNIRVLEEGVKAFRTRYGKKPRLIEELVRKRIISGMPRDPFGGKYYFDPQGNVRTTSEDQLMPYMRKK